MNKAITTCAELMDEMRKGAKVNRIHPSSGRTRYIITQHGMIRTVRREVAEAVMNDLRFRHTDESGAYIYSEAA